MHKKLRKLAALAGNVVEEDDLRVLGRGEVGAHGGVSGRGGRAGVHVYHLPPRPALSGCCQGPEGRRARRWQAGYRKRLAQVLAISVLLWRGLICMLATTLSVLCAAM